MLQRITSWSRRHRRSVVFAWVAVLVAINLGAMGFGGEHKQDFLSPGTDSKAAADLLQDRFPAQSGDTVTVVIHDDDGVTSPDVVAVVDPLLDRFRALPHVTSVVGPAEPEGVAQVSADGATAFATLQLDTTGSLLPGPVGAEMMALAETARSSGVQVELSGQAIDNAQTSSLGAEGPGLLMAALVLLVAFGSLVAMGLPLATALFGVGVGLAAGSLLANLIDVPDWAGSVATMIGLGVGIDYALLIITRYRSELTAGESIAAAAAKAMATAGRAVVFAGLTVMISLLGMLTMNQPYVPGVAFSAVLTVLAVLLAAVTLLPALLGFVGPNINRGRLPWRRRPSARATHGFWHGWSLAIQNHPVLAMLGAGVVLAILVLPLSGLRLGYPDAGNDPTDLTTRRAYDLMTDGFGAGFNAKFVLVADRGDAATMAVLTELRHTLVTTPGVAAVSPPMASPSGDATVLTLTPAESPQDPATDALLKRLRSEVVPDALAGESVAVRIGGITAANADQTTSIASRLPLFIGAVIVLSVLLLMAVFRSVLIALKAAVLNLLSVVASYGVIAYVAEGGWLGQLFGITTPTPVPAFIPMMMFAILFGLSMDYEVFLLSRIREEYLRHRDSAAAVMEGVASTAKVITAAALIMTAIFGAFVLDDQIFLKIVGIGLAAAVLVDATLIRLVLVPATMHLFGDRAWWMPRWLDKALPELRIETPGTGAEPPQSTSPTPGPALDPSKREALA